ncbi:hypothetical protein IJH89_02395, partial [Candidatus Saccharibacteria bacterium]|nr:hypothetical protein [Candidatus Saccharibacteria bacterium]
PAPKSLFLASICVFSLTLSQLSAPFISVANAESQEEITITYPYYGFVEDPENPWATVYDALDETGEVQYSDTFFEDPSPGDHPKLRALSYALALAGYENQADGYPSDPSSPNPKLYDMLTQMGFSDLSSWDITSEENGHSMGTTIGHKTLSSGRDLIVIAPRNYNYLTEWLSNFNVGTSGDHAGFSESANLITERFNEYVESNNFSNYKLWVVGYSRGGAVVDLFAKTINENIENYSLVPDDFYAYTFGAPRASITETNFSNIHDVKDGNDLLLGYLFPEAWGFYNTGTYEEIHPADLEITTSVVNISDLADSSRALGLLATNEGLTEDVGSMNGKDFMDSWLSFVVENGLTREYFDSEVKPPLSAIMKAYQSRTLDKQGELTGFITDTDKGLAAMVAGRAFSDLLSGNYPGSSLEEILGNYPPYQDLVKILKGTAVEADIDDFLSYLTTYMMNYEDYEYYLGEEPAVSEEEFAILKENLPKLVKVLAPIIVADAKYTQETYGENYSLFYTYSLASNAENLVIGHIPESIMPILKSLIPEEIPKAPNTGYAPKASRISNVNYTPVNRQF